MGSVPKLGWSPCSDVALSPVGDLSPCGDIVPRSFGGCPGVPGAVSPVSVSGVPFGTLLLAGHCPCPCVGTLSLVLGDSSQQDSVPRSPAVSPAHRGMSLTREVSLAAVHGQLLSPSHPNAERCHQGRVPEPLGAVPAQGCVPRYWGAVPAQSFVPRPLGTLSVPLSLGHCPCSGPCPSLSPFHWGSAPRFGVLLLHIWGAAPIQALSPPHWDCPWVLSPSPGVLLLSTWMLSLAIGVLSPLRALAPLLWGLSGGLWGLVPTQLCPQVFGSLGPCPRVMGVCPQAFRALSLPIRVSRAMSPNHWGSDPGVLSPHL